MLTMSTVMTVGIPIALLILEWYLGRTDKVEANSTLSLVYNILKFISGRK